MPLMHANNADFDILGRYQWISNSVGDDEEEKARFQSLLEKASENPVLRRDPAISWNQNVMASFWANLGTW